MSRLLIVASALALFSACDYDGRAFTAQPDEDLGPGIKVLGELEIIPRAAWEVDDDRRGAITYDKLGPPPQGQVGGATATFMGTGGQVCVFVDPEAVFWNESVALQGALPEFSWPDNTRDDGDLDMEVGLSAYYTGSPGLAMGTFEQPYEDSLGNQVTIEFNECLMVNYFGEAGGHAGRATPEYCTIDTSLHPDREYTISLRTWSLPHDDYQLAYGVAIFEGPCSGAVSPGSSGNPECALPNEAGGGELNDPDNAEEFADLERAFCGGTQTAYCTDHPDMCGEP